jgi:serine/threonine protein kinase
MAVFRMRKTPSMVPADTVEATLELQDRIARFARAAFVIAAVLLVASVTIDLAMASTVDLHTPTRFAHMFGMLLALVTWRWCRGTPRTLSTLEKVDAALTIGLCMSWAMLSIDANPDEPIEFWILLAMTHTLVARSVFVPSSFRKTLGIGAISSVAILACLVDRRMAFEPGASSVRVQEFYVFVTVWCIVAVMTTAFNSRQLFGLRQRIREVGKLGQYTLEEKIGEGGMGVVYRATHAMLRRPAAIKLLLPDRANARDLARFEREVQLTSRLAHPNTISIFDYGRTAEGVFYYVMELLDGFDLERLVDQDGPLEPARVIRILLQASGSLCEAHAMGLIHRDIKPANLVLTARADEPDVIKVLDFGVVKTLEGASEDATATHVNAIIGTPMYLAPEAITSPGTIDARADIYALGAVGYFLLSGRHVFEAPTVVEICSKHLLEAPVSPSERLGKPVPPDLEALILACLAKRREDRPPSAEALREALLACTDAARYDIAAAWRWWRDREATPRARTELSPNLRDRPPASTSATMTIDFRGRKA